MTDSIKISHKNWQLCNASDDKNASSTDIKTKKASNRMQETMHCPSRSANTLFSDQFANCCTEGQGIWQTGKLSTEVKHPNSKNFWRMCRQLLFAKSNHTASHPSRMMNTLQIPNLMLVLFSITIGSQEQFGLTQMATVNCVTTGTSPATTIPISVNSVNEGNLLSFPHAEECLASTSRYSQGCLFSNKPVSNTTKHKSA